MTDNQAAPEVSSQWAFLMDLLSHDVLNNNQAVLSYLELVLANPETTPKDREYAEKALAQLRTSTLLLENARDMMAVRSGKSGNMQPTDLARLSKSALKELGKFFPGKRFKVRWAKESPAAIVMGNVLLKDLVFNAFVELAKADPGENVEIEARIVSSDKGGKPSWTLLLSDRNAVLQPGARIDDMEYILSQDSSRMVRVSGFLFAMMGAGILGGDFGTKDLGEGKGVELSLRLVKAGEA